MCECGHAFPASSIVAAVQTSKRCPACRSEQPLLLERCGCGHEFKDVVALRGELLGHLHGAWARILIGLLALLLCGAIALTMSGMWTLGLFGGVMLAVRGLMMRADARAGLREIDSATGTLPSARLRRAPLLRSAAAE